MINQFIALSSLFYNRTTISGRRDHLFNKKDTKINKIFWYKDEFDMYDVDTNYYLYKYNVSIVQPMKPENPYGRS